MASERISQRAQLCLRKTVVSHLKHTTKPYSKNNTATVTELSVFADKNKANYSSIFRFGLCLDRGRSILGLHQDDKTDEFSCMNKIQKKRS